MLNRYIRSNRKKVIKRLKCTISYDILGKFEYKVRAYLKKCDFQLLYPSCRGHFKYGKTNFYFHSLSFHFECTASILLFFRTKIKTHNFLTRYLIKKDFFYFFSKSAHSFNPKHGYLVKKKYLA